MESKDFRKRKDYINSSIDITINELEKGYNETVKIRKSVENTREILDDLDEEFRKKTGLTEMDITFLFVAVGLQIAKQYLLSNEKFRLLASQGDKLMKDVLGLAPPKWNEVLLQSVPYDAIRTGTHVSNTGLSGTTHRYRTLGHDPIFGWIFGTVNIMTNSLTKSNFETYQVKNMCIVRRYPLGVIGMFEKAIEYSIDDPKLLAVSVLRQAIHFGSDYFTKQGLPVPVLSIFNDELIMKMTTKWNIDTLSITRGATVTIFINHLIAMIHRIFFDGNTEIDKKLYDVRTRKILSYSNLIATSGNIAVVTITKDMTKLDVGGMAVMIYRLITDAKFIRQVKKEFIFDSYKDMIMSDYLC